MLTLSVFAKQLSLLNEIHMLRVVRHPHCLGLDEFYEGRETIYCVGKYFEGEQLIKAIIEKKRFPESTALQMVGYILRSLEYIHRFNIIHRDLKPENLILIKGTESELALIDFGFACYQHEYNKLFTRCGTPGYVAPEVLHDKPYTTKIDVFSAGVILFIL